MMARKETFTESKHVFSYKEYAVDCSAKFNINFKIGDNTYTVTEVMENRKSQIFLETIGYSGLYGR